MPDARWQRIEQLYHDALERPAEDRLPWLAAACGEDDALRGEIEALMRYDAAVAGALDRSALAVEAEALARDRGDGLLGRRLGDYEVLELLGAGGMGEVYRARDVRLGREVALKVYDDAASLGPVARMEAEARAASVLNHPGIVTVYGVGEEGDTAWIAMELVPGRSLRELLSEAPLPARRALDIAVPLAEALAAAHAHGIVHRDLKPENVMVSPEGRVKVLDFGIATLGHGVMAEGATAPGAGPGPRVGTAGYMSPEQEQGREAGPASDLFSFGVLCHEMLTGRRPSAGATLDLGDNPAALADVVSRCLAKEPGQRYADGAELLAALRRVRDALDGADAAAGLTRRRALALGGWAALGAVAGVAAWRSWSRGTGPRSLAVLPFGNPERDETTEYLCDGIAETLIRQLAGRPGVTVIARATAFTFKGGSLDPRAVGQRLGVAAILTGAVTRRAGRVRISAELVESATGARLWGDEFDRPAGDVLAVQNEIAAAILGDGMGLALSGSERRQLARALTDDPEAYELFLQGVHHLRMGTEDDYLLARALLERAVEHAPRFALALATLASTYSVMAVDGYAPPAEAWPESERYVARALAVDTDLPDAHAEAAASAFFYRWDWDEADRCWSRALRLRSEVQSELLAACALQKWACGQAQAALEMARAARQVDPLSAAAAVREADLLAALGRLGEAVLLYERVIRDQPEDPRARFGLAEAYRKQGRFDEAIAARRLAHEAAGETTLDPVFARARGAAGYEEVVRASARRELERLAAREESGGWVSALDYGRAFAQLGDAERALTRLAAGLEERAAGLVLLKVDPAWDAVRGDARFAAAVARVGIP
jgi:TolB-like protein/predicted Ser/Thr protein kinase